MPGGDRIPQEPDRIGDMFAAIPFQKEYLAQVEVCHDT
jgi:hypothetical protein